MISPQSLLRRMVFAILASGIPFLGMYLDDFRFGIFSKIALVILTALLGGHFGLKVLRAVESGVINEGSEYYEAQRDLDRPYFNRLLGLSASVAFASALAMLATIWSLL